VCQPDPAPTPASATQALATARAWVATLAAADPAALPAQAQAECLQGLEQIEAMITAARAWILGAFTAGQGYCADADYSARAWLIHKTRVTRGAAAGHVGWSRRAVAHPQVLTALAEGTVLSESLARKLCGWTDRLPGDCRQPADEILIAAARAGADERDLAGLAAEIQARARHQLATTSRTCSKHRQRETTRNWTLGPAPIAGATVQVGQSSRWAPEGPATDHEAQRSWAVAFPGAGRVPHSPVSRGAAVPGFGPDRVGIRWRR